ncbi:MULTISPECIES: branched-chain amino acid ABC transporter permease [unclassified Cryobacterium]|uniref:branched-chain amino acid ABC transporter permease n=1 Tax=unclassified Cryobacterium TaxID=2649013 RepID=UPI00106D678D|nr:MULTISPECIES: branched-chain amino acid ABC transporter permease [unclassified Cryobacterium]TFD07599.1 branched-chain amino acid ABC transporter permease [Cryobacterium sp. TMT1-66-1]TFD14478.1 branched-chain amino acid ABC transporter permease [Cryobacterium sp. TMT1-2-2]
MTTQIRQLPATPSMMSPPPARWPHLSTVVIVGLIAAVPLVFFGDYWMFVAAKILAFGIAAMGLQILYGRAGLMSLAQGAFMGVGAYAGYLVAQSGLGPGIQLLAVIAAASLVALIVGLPTLRLSPLRLAIVTLAFGELFNWLLINSTEWTGGSQGAPVEPLIIFGFDTSYPLDAYLVALAFAVPLTLFALNLGQTHLGRRMMAIRDSEMAAVSVGVFIPKTKIIAFVLSAVFGGIGGWLYSATTGFIAPPDFDLFASVFLLAAVVIGGSRSVAGAWMGTAFIVLLPEGFNLIGQPNLYALAGGLLLATTALLLPDGFSGVFAHIKSLITRMRAQEDRA